MTNSLYRNPNDEALDLEYQISINAIRALSLIFENPDPATVITQIFIMHPEIKAPYALTDEDIQTWITAGPGNEKIRGDKLIFYWFEDDNHKYHLRLVNPWQKELPQLPNTHFFWLKPHEFALLCNKSIITSRLQLHWLAQPLASATSDSLWLLFGEIIDDSKALNASMHYFVPAVVSIIAGLAQYYILRLRYQKRFKHPPDEMTNQELMRQCASMAFLSTCASMGWMAGFIVAEIVLIALGCTPYGLLGHVCLALSSSLMQAIVTVCVTLLKQHRNGGISSQPKEIAHLFLSSFTSAMVWYSFTFIYIPIPWVKYTVASIASFIGSAIVYTLTSCPGKVFQNLAKMNLFNRTPEKNEVKSEARNSGFYGKKEKLSPKESPQKQRPTSFFPRLCRQVKV